MKYFVIAGTYDEARRWTALNKHRVYNEEEGLQVGAIRYVDGVETLKGIREPKGIFIGTWYRRPDISEIFSQLMVAQADSKQIQRAMDYYYSEPNHDHH